MDTPLHNLDNELLDSQPIIKFISSEDLSKWINEQEANQQLTLSVLFGGDRLMCCDEFIGIFINGELASVVSISPEGEDNSGQPTIVGIYTAKKFRNSGIGTKILKAAIKRGVERGFQKIQIDVFSSKLAKLINKLEEEYKQYLDVHLLPFVLDLFSK